MDDIIKLALDRTEKRGLALLITRDGAHQSKTDLIANLILNGPLFIVSGDEWLPAFALPRIIRGKTTEITAIMNRLRTVRASTCYRLFDSLTGIALQGEPVLVMGFLHTFYDPDVPLHTRLFQLRRCCDELKRLAFHRPVIVMIQEMEGADYEKFVPVLFPMADKTLTLEPELEQTSQPALF